MDDAQWILDEHYRNYRPLALVASSTSDLAAYRPAVQEGAQFCRRWDMRYEEILGSGSCVRRLDETAEEIRENGIAATEEFSKDFLIVPPGGEIRQNAFIASSPSPQP